MMDAGSVVARWVDDDLLELNGVVHRVVERHKAEDGSERVTVAVAQLDISAENWEKYLYFSPPRDGDAG